MASSPNGAGSDSIIRPSPDGKHHPCGDDYLIELHCPSTAGECTASGGQRKTIVRVCISPTDPTLLTCQEQSCFLRLMATNQNRNKKRVDVDAHITKPGVKYRSKPSNDGTTHSTQTSRQKKGVGQRPNAEDRADLWKWALGVVAIAGTGYGVWKHKEAKEHAAVAEEANRRATAHHVAAQTAERHAQTMAADAANERRRANIAEERAQNMEVIARKEHHRAQVAEDRTHKLAIEVANLANHHIAKLRRETAPLLRFDGCAAAATDRVEIRIDMVWILSGIVDSAKEVGAIFGRMIGVVAHEWHHFLSTSQEACSLHDEELRADKFAGKQLAQLGVQPNHFADLLRVFPQSKTHPDGELRAKIMLEAWTIETQKKEREAAEPVATKAPGRRTRSGTANKSAAKRKKSTAKTGAIQMSANHKAAKSNTPKKRATKTSTKKVTVSATSN